ncbi:DUF2946 family protein [Aquabacterium sp. OR-4]|uniref:DUF2946 family protein n=1 Tax=Aquabacterium sp. OR-4 TaxID=2978127 RepID=UPI0021B1BC83|nr:DUF2946 family protein [Aquabacterium sp. OR-4]MDT7837066.1 DUF2946 family protein [Aquabacterium sp. OR-4]
MHWLLRRHALRAHIALAMLVLAFAAPTVSRLLHALQAQASPWGVVCTVEGAAGGSEPGAPSLEHCPVCLLQQAASAPPPAAPMRWLPADLGEVLPPLFLQAPRPLFAWSAAQARAPPQA